MEDQGKTGETFQDVLQTVQSPPAATESEGLPSSGGDGATEPAGGMPSSGATEPKKRKIYEKEPCPKCGKMYTANHLRWKHDCRIPKVCKKRPFRVDVPLPKDPPKLEPTALAADPPRTEPTLAADESKVEAIVEQEPPPPTLRELRQASRRERQDRFAFKMFG